MKAMFVFLIVLAVVLSGCTPQTVRVVQTEKLMLVSVDPVLLQDCDKVVPPSVKAYAEMGIDEREDALIRLSMEQGSALQRCTVDKQKLRESLANQQKIIDKHNSDEAARVAALH